jgi:hypothetical protein
LAVVGAGGLLGGRVEAVGAVSLLGGELMVEGVVAGVLLGSGAGIEIVSAGLGATARGAAAREGVVFDEPRTGALEVLAVTAFVGAFVALLGAGASGAGALAALLEGSAAGVLASATLGAVLSLAGEVFDSAATEVGGAVCAVS